MLPTSTKKRLDGSGKGIANVVMRLCAVVLAVTLVVLGGIYVHYRSFVGSPVLAAGEQTTVVIPPDTAWPTVVSILRRQGVIDRAYYFEAWARRRHLPAAVKAGTYELSGPLSLVELANKLRNGGRVAETTVTFPEGWTIFDLADRVDAVGLADRGEFLRAARDRQALDRAGIDADSFEGYLFPDTYRFRKGTAPADIIERLHGRWEAVWLALSTRYQAQIARLQKAYDFDRHDIVTLASLVERETSADAERSVIARVFLNRLDRDMRLQTDPTCVYGKDTYDKVPTPALCKDPLNRYSTYVIDGLPPGPIANPGRASLDAALTPSAKPEAKRYLFFVARRDGSGQHFFSKTFAQHRRAIRRFLK